MRAVLLGLASAALRFSLDAPAKCLDGSPAVYYADLTGSNEWLIYLQGGGACSTETACISRTFTRLGTSLYHPRKLDFQSGGYAMFFIPGMLSPNATLNPHFASFNRVFVPYCSGDLYAGRQTISQVRA